MDEIFKVSLSNGNGCYADLSLPATDYQLLDALERLRMKPGDKPSWEILDYKGFEPFGVYLDDGNIYELNALASKIETMDSMQMMAFEGLFNIALNRKEGPMSFNDLMTYANSVDSCNAVPGARDDAALGRFYCEYGFVPEVEDLPDAIFEQLDFAKIGREMRQAERGAYVNGGYVVQTGDLQPVSSDYVKLPATPDYAFRLLIGQAPFDPNNASEPSIPLEFPADQQTIARALEEANCASWAEVAYEVQDSAIPGLLENMDCESSYQLNALANATKQFEMFGELPKYKAILSVMGCEDIEDAMYVADYLDDFILEQDKVTPIDVGREEIRFSLNTEEANILLKHVNLYSYGEELMEHYNSQLTDYGLIARRNGAPIQNPEEDPQEMTM